MCSIDPHFAEPGPGVFLARSEWSLPGTEGEAQVNAVGLALPQPSSVDWDQESPPTEITTGGIDPIPTSWLRPATGFLPRHPEFKPELITDPCWLPPPPSCWQPPLTEEGIAEPGAVDQLTGLEYQSEINIDPGTQIDGEWSIPISYEVCQKPFVFSYQIRTVDRVTALTSQERPSETVHSEQVKAFASWSNLADSAEYLEASNNIEVATTSESQAIDRQSAHGLQAVDTPSAPTEIAPRSISAERAVISIESGSAETTVLAISRSSEPARVNDVVADDSQEGSAEAFADSALSLLINSSLSQSGIAAMPPFAISDQPTTVDALFSSRRFVRAAKSYPR